MSPRSSVLPASTEKERAVQRMFSAIARWYDLNNTVLSFGLHHRWKREAVVRAQAKPGQTVLDLCAGTCDLALLLAERVGPTGRVVACDLNAEMLAVGRSKVDQRGDADRIVCEIGNAEALQFPDASFDALTVADRKSTRLNSSHIQKSRMPSSA